jgi:hypothetical protein
VEFDEEVILGYDLWGMHPPWCGGSSGYAPVSSLDITPILYTIPICPYAHIGNHIATSGHLLPTKHLRRPSHAACGKFLSEFDRAGKLLLISLGLELNTLEKPSRDPKQQQPPYWLLT